MFKRLKKVKKTKKKKYAEQPPERDASGELDLPLDESSPANFDHTAEKDTLTYDLADQAEGSEPDDLPAELQMLSVPKFMLGAQERSATFAVLSHKKMDSTLSFRLQTDIDPAWLKRQHRAREEQKLIEEHRFDKEPPLKPKLHNRINYMKNNRLKNPKTTVLSAEGPSESPQADTSQKPTEAKRPQESKGPKSLIPSKVQNTPKPASSNKVKPSSPRNTRPPSAATFRKPDNSGQHKKLGEVPPKSHHVVPVKSSGLQKQTGKPTAKNLQVPSSKETGGRSKSISEQRKPCHETQPAKPKSNASSNSVKGTNFKVAAMKVVGPKIKLTRGTKTFDLTPAPKTRK